MHEADAGSGFWKQFVVINRGSGNEYFGNPMSSGFNGVNLGSWVRGDPRYLNGAEANTWENSGDWASNVRFNYRFGTSGDFTLITLSQRSQSGGDRMWDKTAEGILMTGFAPGSYTLQVYFQGQGNWSGGNWQYYDSANPNYGATFTITEIGNPTSLSATPGGTTSIDLSWARWSSRNVVIVRNTTGTFSDPTQGAAPPSVGQSYAGGTLIYNGSGTSHSDTGLASSTTYYYRFFSINNNYYSSGGSANATTDTPAVPAITVEAGTLAFGSVAVGSSSSAQSYTVSGANLSGNITVTAPTHFQVATSEGGSYGSSISLGSGGGTVWARYAPSSAGSHSANITHAATGADTENKAVTGTGVAIPSAPSAQASSSPSTTGFTANWNASSGATSYRLDVATDSGFANMVSGYSNLDVGNVTSYAVTVPVVGHYYYRVRAVNLAGTSGNSSTISAGTSTANGRNPDGAAEPVVSIDPIHVGDTVVFGSESWGQLGTQWGRARLWVHTDSTVQNGSSSAAWSDYTQNQIRNRSWQFTSVGTYYWGMQYQYGDHGTNFWYVRDVDDWSPLSYAGTNSGLSVTVNALQPPTGVSVSTPANLAHRGTRADLQWTRWNNRNILVVRRAGSPVTWTPTQGTAYSAGQNVGSGHTVVQGSLAGTSYEDSGLAPGTTYYYEFFSENFSYYSGSEDASYTTHMPRGRNTDGEATPQQPATIYLGDTNQTFGLEAWGNIEGSANSGRARLWIHTAEDVSAGASGPWTSASSVEHRQPTSVQFTQTGTWYWGVQLEYGTYGNGFWYKQSFTEWTDLSLNGNNSTLTVTVSPLGEPTSVSATPASSSAIDLSWAKWSGRNVLIVRRQGAAVAWTPTQGTLYSNGQDLGNDTVVLSFSTHLTSWEDSGLVSDTTYHYRIFSENYGYYSDGVAASATTGSGPTPPLLDTPTVSSVTVNSATLGANISSTGGSAITSRGTVWGEDPEPTGNVLAAGGTDTGAFSHSRTSLPAGTLIYFRGYAVNGIGTGYSADGSFWTVPAAPTVGAASGIGGSSFTANWSASTGATGYRLDVATDSGFSSLVSGQNNRNVGNVTSASVTGLNPDTVYYYRVRAYNTGGTSANSGTTTVQTEDVQIPDPPTTTPATPVTTTSFTATWGASAGATTYYLDVSTNPNFTSFVSGYNNANVGNTTSFEISGQAGEKYYYRVRAANEEGISAASAPIGVVRQAIPAGSFTMVAPPVLTDRSFDGELGDVLAGGLSAGDQIYVFQSTNQAWRILTLDSGGDWLGQSGLVLDPGQAFFVQRNSGSTANLGFSGSIGNSNQSTVTIRANWNLIGLSEGRSMTINNAFSNLDSGSVVANWNDQSADQVYLQNADGSWRRFYRTPSGWFDFGTGNINNNFSLEPGRAYYYKRQSSGGNMVVRF